MFTTPEFITGPIKISQRKLSQVIRSSPSAGVDMPAAITMATPTVMGVSEKGRE